MTTPIKLNLGAGNFKIEGYTAIDRKLGTEAYPLTYEDDSVKIIRASHVLEHFNFADSRLALADWYRSLQPGGIMRIAVPDFDQISARRSQDSKWAFYLMGGQTDDDDVHKSVWSADLLVAAMQNIGLVDLQSWSDDVGDCASHLVTVNIQGRKPLDGEVDVTADEPDTDTPVIANMQIKAKIAAIGSIPRLGWQDHHGCCEAAMKKIGIQPRHFNGVFWGIGMSNALEDMRDEGIDWVFTLDYDSVFTAKHIDDMLQIFARYPHIDALCCNEVRRNEDTPLATVKGLTAVGHTGEPIRLHTGHFGLTLIRMSALTEVPMPWFKSEPGPNGSWRHEDCLHEDIWFWHQWKKAGKTLYLAPDVRVGQLEMTVVEFDEDMRAQRLRINDWMKREYGRTSRHEVIPALNTGGAS